MNFSDLLQPDVQKFILENVDQDVSKLILKKNPFPNLSWSTIANQIISKRKAKTKLPTWFNLDNIVFPLPISIEQTSSEIAAKHKAAIVSGELLIDLTGGFGVDCYYFSKKMEKVIHCEINDDLSSIVQHNFEVLNTKNIECKNGDGFEILKRINQKADWIYIDPSRRNDSKGKVFMLKDCLPNVPLLLNDYFTFSDKILVKTAPILDITAGLLELKNVKCIHIVAINNEVKEILWEIWKRYSGNILIKTTNYNKTDLQNFEFELKENKQTVEISEPKKYLYEPNAAILKSGAFNEVAIQFRLSKLHQHSHLYTSDDLIDFPGRVFIVNQYFDYSNVEMKNFMQNKKFNITTRNFPISVEDIRKKWKIIDGGNLYSFFTTNVNNNKIVLICEKI